MDAVDALLARIDAVLATDGPSVHPVPMTDTRHDTPVLHDAAGPCEPDRDYHRRLPGREESCRCGAIVSGRWAEPIDTSPGPSIRPPCTPFCQRCAAGDRQHAHQALLARLSAGEASDGYHTHNELYEYRLVLHAHAVRAWLALGYPVWKSWHHSDGEKCFGGGWFIVVAQLPTGQVSNHYQAEHWDLFAVTARSRPPEYDGHTPAEALQRMRDALGQL